MTPYRPGLFLLIAFSTAAAADPNAEDDPLGRRVASLRVTVGEETADLASEPLLRYSDPARETTDGRVWALGGPGRPAALFSLFVEPAPPWRRTPPGARLWSYEFVSLSDVPIRATRPDEWQWKPETSALKLEPIPDAPPPDESDKVRSRQMRLLARRFSASESFQEEDYALRLLDRPLVRYSDPEAGVDGALFAFVYGTNPEVILVLESDRRVDEGRWRYGFVRTSAAASTARLDERDVWSVELFHVDNRRETEPYNVFWEDELPEDVAGAGR